MTAAQIVKDIKSLFNNIDKKLLFNQQYLENNLILDLGLNNENLSEQPKELSNYFGAGMGLRIWQYPNQFSKYLMNIYENAPTIRSYLEIGCRHGGTYILTTEFLSKMSSTFNKSVAVDIIEPNELLLEYINSTDSSEFIKINSGSDIFKEFISNNFFDLIFIDGDHSYNFVKSDAETTRDYCNIQVFHDTVNDACPGVGVYWNELKQSHKDVYSFYDFIDQYNSVDGNYLGIGVAIRKNWI